MIRPLLRALAHDIRRLHRHPTLLHTTSQDLSSAADSRLIDAVLHQVPYRELATALRRAGYELDYPSRRLIQKPGICQDCGRVARLQPAYNSDRWLCHQCALDELAST